MFQRLTITLITIAVLVACGGQPTTQPATIPDTVSPLVASTGNCSAAQRLFEHELLEGDPVCIPSDPQRIIALDMASVEMTLLAGKTLLATSGWILSELPLLHPPFAKLLAAVEDVGYPANLEKVALLKPDLILAVGGTTAGDSIDADQARQIAPLVFADPVIYNDWKLGMRLWADVLGMSDWYDAMAANYQTRIGELRAALGTTIDREISVLSVSSYGISLWMPDTPPGAILSDVGLERPEAQNLIGEAATARYRTSQYIPISTERLDLADGDAIFYFTYASRDPEIASKERNAITMLEQQPVWQSLKAVRAGQAFLVPEYWWRSQTYLLANKVLDDLFLHLANTKASTPVIETVP
ncbi:ABC transporter substrate-binding protein [Chloroflexus islandicus]|uniref:ABC transporter substrate-binding protein n=1 Tax=Chloroflexus islandicus TaxID=1707952 RepID=A0A178MJ52_9CHLR|nr:iron-siderophore ABC transporter substrate-binding protein [Chloroflexus islandicus]OAN48583.1 ABC transporter substrate-binding protein [Chloroflexus islandicus]